jgi:UDP-glucose 4-epimerase
VADSRVLQERFRWQPRCNDLRKITASALAWERRIRQLNTNVAQS